MSKYNNAKIYKLYSPEGDEVYIGSTTTSLNERFNCHKCHLDCSSKILFEKYNDVRIELIMNYPCETKQELFLKEGEYITNTANCINNRISGRTKKEYMKEYIELNKERINEYKKEYREQNKEYKKEYNKKYREQNKDKAREYREQNKDKAREYNKRYREKRKQLQKE